MNQRNRITNHSYTIRFMHSLVNAVQKIYGYSILSSCASFLSSGFKKIWKSSIICYILTQPSKTLSNSLALAPFKKLWVGKNNVTSQIIQVTENSFCVGGSSVAFSQLASAVKTIALLLVLWGLGIVVRSYVLWQSFNSYILIGIVFTAIGLLLFALSSSMSAIVDNSALCTLMTSLFHKGEN